MIHALQTLRRKRHVTALGRRTVDWLSKHASDFAITRTAAESIPWRVKPLVELTFLLTIFRRHGFQSHSLNRLSIAALAEAHRFDWQQLAAYDPSAATGLAVVADFFRTMGHPAPFDSRYFALLNSVDYFDGMDRLPYRDMDLAYTLTRVVSAEYEARIPNWFASTAFGRRQHTVRYSIDDLYSLTHAVFYLSDVGFRSTDTLLTPQANSRLLAELPTITGAMLRADNTDVLGELMLCWLFCGVELTALNRLVFRHALDQMMAAVTTEGAIAPNAHIAEQAKSGRATFAQLYHTTLVGAILFHLLDRNEIYALC